MKHLLQQRLARRPILSAAGTSLTGIAAAALVGCGGSKTTGANGASPTSNMAGAGIPKDITNKRAPGLNPKLGEAAVNRNDVERGGTLVRPYTDTSRQNDPDISIAGADWEMLSDRLLYANGWTMQVTPDMLASYELVDKQGLQFVLKLRPGIATHNKPPVNGRVFTAKDVVYSIMRKAGKLDPVASKKYARIAQYAGLEKAEAVDDTTIRVTFKTPDGSFLPALADPRAQMIPVEMEDVGFKDPRKFVGTGAWIETEYTDGARQTFEANPAYYRQWDDGGHPGWDKYQKLVIADRASMLAAFLSRQVSYFSGIQPQEEPQLRASAKDALWTLNPGPTWDHFAVNLTLPMWKDVRVRQAIQLALDYKALADPLGKGWIYAAGTHPMFPESYSSDEVAKLPGYNAATKERDVADAMKLMGAAGYDEGAGLSWEQINSGPSVSDSNVRIKDQLTKIWPHISINLKPISDYASFTNLLNTKAFQARAYNHTSVPDAAGDARTYYHTTGGRNYQAYSQPWADEILDKMLQAQTLDERRQQLRSFLDRYLKEGPPLILLRTPPDSFVVQPDVAGFDMSSGPWGYQSYGVSVRWTWRTRT